MTLKIHPLNRVVLAVAATLVFFVTIIAVFPIQPVVMVLNGVFAGCAVAIIVTYWKLVWNAILGIHPYDRVRQMTLGFAICWTAYGIGVLTAIYLQSTGLDIRATYAVTFSRLLAIIAAVLQVTAPDFGLGLFHGRERKTLWTAVILGAIAAIIAVTMQGTESLAEQMPTPGQTASYKWLTLGTLNLQDDPVGHALLLPRQVEVIGAFHE